MPSQLSQHPLTIPRDLGKSQRSFSTRLRIRLYDDEHIKSQDVIVACILSKAPFSVANLTLDAIESTSPLPLTVQSLNRNVNEPRAS